jgi:hypothetical protein
MKLFAWCCPLSLLVAGCSFMSESTRVNMVTDRAAFDLSCEKNNVRVQKITENSYGAAGCGSKVTYLLDSCSGSESECKVHLDSVQSTNTNLHPAGDAGTD